MNSIVKSLGRKAIKAFLLVTPQSIQGNRVSASPRLNLRKQRCKITALESCLSSHLSRWEDTKLCDVRCEAVVEPCEGSTEKEVATADATIVEKIERRATLIDGRN